MKTFEVGQVGFAHCSPSPGFAQHMAKGGGTITQEQTRPQLQRPPEEVRKKDLLWSNVHVGRRFDARVDGAEWHRAHKTLETRLGKLGLVQPLAKWTIHFAATEDVAQMLEEKYWKRSRGKMDGWRRQIAVDFAGEFNDFVMEKCNVQLQKEMAQPTQSENRLWQPQLLEIAADIDTVGNHALGFAVFDERGEVAEEKMIFHDFCKTKGMNVGHIAVGSASEVEAVKLSGKISPERLRFSLPDQPIQAAFKAPHAYAA